MCARWSLADTEELDHRFHASLGALRLLPRYNIAPTQEVPVILSETPHQFTMAKWGLIPSWAKDEKIGVQTINARAETLATKPAFRMPFKSQHCLIPADGFYEWKGAAGNRIPFRFTVDGGKLFAFAGLYDKWRQDNREILTFTIITTEPNEIVGKVHNRMPAILVPENEGKWLDAKQEDAGLLNPFPSGRMKSFQVSRLLNNPRNEGPELIRPEGSLSAFIK